MLEGLVNRPLTTWTRATLATLLGATLEGEDANVTSLKEPKDATLHDLTCVLRENFLPAALESDAGVLVVSQEAKIPNPRAVIRVADIESAWVLLLRAFAPSLEREPGIHASAVVHETAQIEAGVSLGANVVIARDAKIGTGSVIGAGSYIGERTSLGAACLIHPNVTILHDVQMGARVLVQSGAVIGSDGFGFQRTQDKHHIRQEQIGGVLIEDDVEIGVNSVIDRGTITTIRIGARSKIGPACVIAHNSSVGCDSLLIGAVQLAGSVTVGDRVVLWGQVGSVGHITIGSDTMVTAQSGISKDIPAGGGVYRGAPAIPIREHLRFEANQRDIGSIKEKLKALEAKILELESK
jgi:UDP-3-O-[3-hydroxymyristoyl] glucosamine N-acyltransferase